MSAVQDSHEVAEEDAAERRNRREFNKYKRGEHKYKRMMGQVYTGSSKKKVVIKQPRAMGPRCESVKCEKSSKHFCSKIQDADRQKIFKSFWKKMNWDEKKEYVRKLVDVIPVQRRKVAENSRRSFTFVFFLKVDEQRMRVCRRLFLATLGIGEWTALHWAQDTGRMQNNAESGEEDETPGSSDLPLSQLAQNTSAEQEQGTARNPERQAKTPKRPVKRKRTGDADETPVLRAEDSNAKEAPCTNTACRATVKALTDQCAGLRAEIIRLKKININNVSFKQESFRDNDEMVHELTGLASYTKFMIVFSLVSGFLKAGPGLTSFECFLITLMRMRLNLPLSFFGHMFKVSRSTITEVFNSTLDVMHQKLSRLIVWPGKEQIQISLPMCIRDTFNNCTSIIDCLEIHLEKTKNMPASAPACSQNKNHDMVKYLISMTPKGVVSFVSKGMEGQISDQCLIETCGYLNKLTPGDVMLSDMRFNLKEASGLRTADLKIQAFAKRNQQLYALELDETKGLAPVQIHVERVVSLVRNKYTILQSTIPLSLCSTADEGRTTTLDKMVTVCCALCNICPPVIPSD